MLSNRIQIITPSATLAIQAKALELKKQGVQVLSLATGEPDFDTPDHIKNAAKQALDDGFTKYTAASGIPELKDAICQKLRKVNKIQCERENIIICNGGKQALFNTFMAILNDGDEVVVPSPYWVSYADMIRVCGGKVITIDTRSTGFKLTAEMVEKKITPKVKAVILNSPSNPTGMMMEEEEILKVGKLAKQHNFLAISDEVYETFCYDSRKSFSLASQSDMSDHVVTINAFSKTYSMTGWRVGYAVGPKTLIEKMSGLQSHSTSNPCSIAQKAALAAIQGSQDCVKKMADAFLKRRDFMFESIKQIPKLSLLKPEGAFYAFIKVSELYNNEIKNSFNFSQKLLEELHLAVVPGGAFGEEGDQYVRLSYAASMEDLAEAVKRLKTFVKNIEQ